MREVQVVARVEKPASEVYPTICDFRRYPEQSSAVLAVDVRSLDGARRGCSWEVRFRRGILRWSEEDVFDDEKRRVAFHLIEGDVDHLRGCWEVDEEDTGSRVRFWAEFDMGIPTLAHILEPIAQETLRDNIVLILRGLVGKLEILETTPELGSIGS